MEKHRCSDWSESAATTGQRKAARKQMDKHIAKKPACADSDVCVHGGLIFDAAYCCRCGASI